MFPAGRHHAGRAAGGHERLQIAAASLDEGLDPDLQEAAADDLAQQAALPDQTRGDRRISPRTSPTSCSLVFACSCIPPSAGRSRAGSACCSSTSRSSSRPRCSVGGLLYMRATRAASAHLDEGDPAPALRCSRSASAFRLTMPARCSRRCSTTSPISPARRSTGSSARNSRGATANTCRSSRCCRSSRWASRFISPTSFGSPSDMANTFRAVPAHVPDGLPLRFVQLAVAMVAEI